MEDSSDSLSDLFKKPDSIRFVQNQSRVSESPVSLSSKDNSVSNVSDSGSVLSAVFQKPKKCMVSSTNCVSDEVTPNSSTAHQNINIEDTVVCRKKKFNFNDLQSTNCSNIFGNTPTSLCESVARIPKRKKKCLKSADTKVTALSVQFSVCDTTESSVVLPKKQLAKRSAVDRSTNFKASSLFEKNESSFLSNTFPPAHSHSMNTTNGPESSVVLNKKKSTLKGSKRFSTTNLFDSEPNSVCESFTENKRKTKRFRDDTTHQQLSLKDLSEFSNVSGGNYEKLIHKPLASFVEKENIDVNFDNTVSSISDSVIEKRGGGFLNTFKKTKNSTANATVDIFSHPEGLSDDCESSSVSEGSEKDPTSNSTCEDESSSCREPESTNRSASTFEEESSSCREPESTNKSASIGEDESSTSCREPESINRSASIGEDESSTSCREPESINRSASIGEDESSTSCREPESTQKSASFYEQDSMANEDNTIQASQGDLSVTICQDQNSVLSGNRSLRESASFRVGSNILADISAIEKSKLTIQPTLLELDENKVFEISVENVSPKFDTEINESSIDKFVLTLEMSEQQKSVESALEKTDITKDPDQIVNIQISVVDGVTKNAENQLTPNERSVAEESSRNPEDIRKSAVEVPLLNKEDEQVPSEEQVDVGAESIQLASVEKPTENMSPCESLEEEPNRSSTLESIDKVDDDPTKSIENIQMSLMEAVSVNTENIQSSLMQFSVAEDFSTNLEDIRMSITDTTLKNGGAELLPSKMEAHAESPLTKNAEKSSENMSLCKSMELEPNRICLLETRKKRQVSPVSFKKVDGVDDENRNCSLLIEDQLVEAEMNVSKGVNEVKASTSPKSISEDLNMESCSRLLVEALCETVSVTQTDSEAPFSVQMVTVNESKNRSENRSSQNLVVDNIMPNDTASAKLNISKVDGVGDENVSFDGVDDRNFSLAVEPGSELSLSDVTMSRPSSSMCHSAKSNEMSNRINDETRVLHSATFISSVPSNCTPNVQNNTYTVQDPVIIKDGTRTSQTLSAIFQRPRVFALSQNESDSESMSQNSSNVDVEKNRTYTVKTLTDESSVLLTKKKAAFPELPVGDDLNMFSVNSHLLSDTVTVERRVTRSSARLSALSAMLDESVPSQPRNLNGSRINISRGSLVNELVAPEAMLIEESKIEGASVAINQSLIEEKSTKESVSEKSEHLEESVIGRKSQLLEKSESEKSQLDEESALEEESHPMEESENDKESELEEESEREEQSEPEEESEQEEESKLVEESEQEEKSESEEEESEPESEEEESEPEAEEEESEPMEQSEKNQNSKPSEQFEPEKESHATKELVPGELDKSDAFKDGEESLAAGESRSKNKKESQSMDKFQSEKCLYKRNLESEDAESQPVEESLLVNAESHVSPEQQEERNETESGNFRDADESSDTSSLFKRPDSVYFTRSRSRNASMSLSSSRKKSVSFAQPADCTQFSSQSSSSRSKTQTTNSSVSLVRKMCEDKSTVKGAGKMLPPKLATKKRRKPLRFELDSDDDEQADDSISVLPKKPNFPKFSRWCGKQFYSRIIEKMKPKYGLKTNVEAVRLAEYVWQSVKQVESCKDADANHEKVEEMKRVLARKQIVVTHYQFYIFCIRNLPITFHWKALPMGPLFPCKFDLTKWQDPILEDS